jgi:hypothetical protein
MHCMVTRVFACTIYVWRLKTIPNGVGLSAHMYRRTLRAWLGIRSGASLGLPRFSAPVSPGPDRSASETSAGRCAVAVLLCMRVSVCPALKLIFLHAGPRQKRPYRRLPHQTA